MPPFRNDRPRTLTPERISEIETFIKGLPEGTTRVQQARILSEQFGLDISLYLDQKNPEIRNRIQVDKKNSDPKPAHNYIVDFVEPATPPVKHFSEVDQAPEIRPDPENPGQFITVEPT